MPPTGTARRYGKSSKRSKANRLFVELPLTPPRQPIGQPREDPVKFLTERLSSIHIENEPRSHQVSPLKETRSHSTAKDKPLVEAVDSSRRHIGEIESSPIHSAQLAPGYSTIHGDEQETSCATLTEETTLRILAWEDVCPPGDQIEKIAEASFAEVYRVTNDRGTSIIKVIRLPSPIKPQTKSQVKARLVDELPHSESELEGELQISEWLAEIPGFVVYKERYVVQGKATAQMLETHQRFQRRMKRRDPGRAQFYPSPSRYLDGTRFLVVELGDAGIALEHWDLTGEDQLWDIFFLEAVALARAEGLVMFEHRDLHEGNLCIKRTRGPTKRQDRAGGFFGYSGLDITILDYGLSRAEDLDSDDGKLVAYDLEKELGIFSSTHGAHCDVYRRMRSFLLRADRSCLPPSAHQTPYEEGIDGPLSWEAYAPYTNVLWLAYLYDYLVVSFTGPKSELAQFRAETRELWAHLDPDAAEEVPCFGSAEDVVHFAVEAGWIKEEQLAAAGCSVLEREDSILVSVAEDGCETPLRRSPRRKGV